ncbi:hypothetical protein [Halopelagius fulvigenes]|uniref:Small CPxCG-related zinc finger protein n=1 Tax=Halopelagius fulvigenes TaxID=1198324 RepID=A0ABD5U569_9EURY
MHCRDCEVEMHRADDRVGSDCADRRTYECPECGETRESARWRSL